MWVLVAGLVVLLAGIATTSATRAPGGVSRTAASGSTPAEPPASPTATPPAGPNTSAAPVLPLPIIASCPPRSADPLCSLPAETLTPTTAPSGGITLSTGPPVSCFPGSLQPRCQPGAASTATSPPCTGEDCIPPPVTSVPGPSGGTGNGGSSSGGGTSCSWSDFLTDFGTCLNNAVSGAISSWLSGLVADALNPMLELLGDTLLTTPMPSSLPQIGYLWTTSWQVMIAGYGILVVLAGITVMTYQTLQFRYSIKEMLPRVAGGFLAGTLSLFLATKAIEIANALAQAILGQGVDTTTVATQLKAMLDGSQNGGIFLILLGVVLAGLVAALLVVYLVRLIVTVLLIAGAPLALMCHALPATEGVAFWWYRAGAAVLGIQVGQSLVLVAAFRVLFAPGGFTLPGSRSGGVGLLVNLLGAGALFYLLFRIPFWLLSATRISRGRSLVATLLRIYLLGRIFGVLGGGRGGRSPRPSGGGEDGGGANGGGGRGPSDPYARTRTTIGGQYVLPLTGVRRRHRTHAAPTPTPAPVPTPRPARGRRLALPLGDDWPEWKRHGPGGQYRLPLDVARVKPTAPPPGQGARGGRPRGRSRGGQQLELPFDPYKGNRANRGGQYPLPLEGVHRVAPAKPVPPKPVPATPAPPPRRTPRAGRQLRLPLDLPRPVRRTPPRSPGSAPGGDKS